MLDDVGWADAVIVRETPDGYQILDGHLRTEMTTGKVPCLVVDLDDHEADLLLATHDHVTGLAGIDQSKLDDLLSELSCKNEDVQSLLSELAEQAGSFFAEQQGFPDLNEEKSEFCTMTFSVSEEQRDTIEQALRLAKNKTKQEGNANGNALCHIAEAYVS